MGSLLDKVAESVDDEPIVVPRLGMRPGDSLRIISSDERGFSGESISRGGAEEKMSMGRSWRHLRPHEAFDIFRRAGLDAEGTTTARDRPSPP